MSTIARHTKLKNKAKLARKINAICEPYCSSEYCILKEIICSSHDDLRFLVQLKCLEIFKWNLSSKKDTEVSMEDTLQIWIANGMAKYFAEYYTEDIAPEALYKKVEGRAVTEGTYKKQSKNPEI